MKIICHKDLNIFHEYLQFSLISQIICFSIQYIYTIYDYFLIRSKLTLTILSGKISLVFVFLGFKSISIAKSQRRKILSFGFFFHDMVTIFGMNRDARVRYFKINRLPRTIPSLFLSFSLSALRRTLGQTLLLVGRG